MRSERLLRHGSRLVLSVRHPRSYWWGVLVVALSCARPAAISDVMASPARGLRCPAGTLWERDTSLSAISQALDLDCDGALDTVRIQRFDSVGVVFWRLTATTRGRQVYVTSPWEGQPELVGAVDLDADGVLDLLAVVADESSIIPWLVRVGGSGPGTLPIAGPPQSYQYLFGDSPSDSCVAAAMPRVTVDSRKKGAIRLAVNSTELAQACPAIAVRFLRWEDDSLRVESK
jgi:hypothetical protein